MELKTQPPALLEVAFERTRQDTKWGEQNHQDGTGPQCLGDLARTGTSADAAREQCDRMFDEGRGTWANILWEEFAEALEETDPEKLKKELIQVAAVAVAWVDAINRRGGA